MRKTLVVLIFAGLLLRFVNLDGKSLWLDEAYSVVRASQAPAAVWTTASDPHPPLYYLVLHGALRFGTSESTARFPSAVASAIGVVLLFVLARRLAGQQVALLAAALLALSPLDLWYAQEARMYACVSAAGLLAGVGLTMSWWPGVLVVATGLTAGVYFDYVMPPLWIGITAAWMVVCARRGDLARRVSLWLVASVAASAATAPLWAHLHATVTSQVGGSYLTTNLQQLIGLPQIPGTAYPYLLLGAGVLAIAGAICLERLLSHRRARTVIVPLLLILAFVAATAAAPLPRFYTVKKLAVTGWPFVVLLSAWLIVRAGRWQGLCAGTALAVSLAASVVNVWAMPKDDWRGLVAYVNSSVPPHEPVWLDPSWNAVVYDHYAPRWPPASAVSGASLEETLGTRPVVWLAVQRRFGSPIPGSPSEAWLDDHATLRQRVSFARLELRRYEPRGRDRAGADFRPPAFAVLGIEAHDHGPWNPGKDLRAKRERPGRVEDVVAVRMNRRDIRSHAASCRVAERHDLSRSIDIASPDAAQVEIIQSPADKHHRICSDDDRVGGNIHPSEGGAGRSRLD